MQDSTAAKGGGQVKPGRHGRPGGRSAQPPAVTHRPRNRTGHNVKNVSQAFQRATFRRMQSRIHGRPSAHGCWIDSSADSNTRRIMAANVRNGASWVLCVCRLCISGSYGRQWAKAQTVSAAQADFRRGGVLRFAAHEKAADHSGSGLAIYINNPVGIITTARALPLKKIFLNPPLGGFTQPEKPAFFRNRLKSVLCF